MTKGFLVLFGAGLGIVAIAVGLVFFFQRGEHLQATGSILKARTAELEKTRTVLVLDVRIVNDSDVALNVKSLDMSVEAPDGRMVEGTLLTATDVKSTFEYYPVLGQLFNPVLTVRDAIPPQTTVDKTVAATFEAFLPELDDRKSVTLRIADDTGSEAEIVDRKRNRR